MITRGYHTLLAKSLVMQYLRSKKTLGDTLTRNADQTSCARGPRSVAERLFRGVGNQGSNRLGSGGLHQHYIGGRDEPVLRKAIQEALHHNG
jgi:hypothetical protein